MPQIKELRPGAPLRGVYLVRNNRESKDKNGNPYFSLTLQDKTGQADAKIWNIDQGIESYQEGDLVAVEGETTEYKGKLQLKITRLRKVNAEEADLSDFYPESPRDKSEMMKELETMIKATRHKGLHALLRAIFYDRELLKKYSLHSAAQSVHHAFIRGLLHHSLNVAKLCESFVTIYPELNRDLMVTAALLHDIGKMEELSPFPSNEFTDAGNLLGHIPLGILFVERKVEEVNHSYRSQKGLEDDLISEVTKNELLHCILSHHGKLEFGSPVVPKLREALALSFADNLDSKMEIFREVMETMQGSQPGTWSQRNFFLETMIRGTLTEG